MSITMIGLDYKSANLEVREAFSLTTTMIQDTLRSIAGNTGIEGCALLSTCNRTELYLSFQNGHQPDGVALLCEALALPAEQHRNYFIERAESEALLHLLRVASGMESQILGEDQILTQVKTAIAHAREAKTADPVLETLFRCAVTAGKRVKTSISFARAGSSVAMRAVEKVEELAGGWEGKKALVIGNGVIGRLAATEMAERGCDVMVTLRNYSHGKPDVPAGCDPVSYEDRYAAIAQCDVLISATTSPHHTVKLEEMRRLDRYPSFLVDLAVPRDIEPEIQDLDSVTLLNVDDLKQGSLDENAAQFEMAAGILQDQAKRFEQWRQNRARLQQNREGQPNFPVFINLHGLHVLIAGGGTIATRRVDTLLRFGAQVVVVSPEVSPDIERHASEKKVVWKNKKYETPDLEGMALAVAATDDRAANRQIGREAKERGILVSVADKREECSFYFPAILQSDSLTAGLISNRGDHTLVRKAAAKLREGLESFDEEAASRK